MTKLQDKKGEFHHSLSKGAYPCYFRCKSKFKGHGSGCSSYCCLSFFNPLHIFGIGLEHLQLISLSQIVLYICVFGDMTA